MSEETHQDRAEESPEETVETEDADEEVPPPNVAQTRGMRIEDLFKLLSMPQDNKLAPKPMEQYKFWKTQPVRKFGDAVDQEGPIDSTKTVDDVATEPYPLRGEFEWSTIDVTNVDQLQEVYELLYGNYIEDDDEAFRFKYSPAFLSWSLRSPGWKVDWNVGVRVKDTGKLVGFISGIPGELRVRQNPHIRIAEINFLCVHKKLRSKRLAPLLILEVTRRINLTGVWQALHTGGVMIPSPISTARYYHRSINWPKLYDVGFAGLPTGSTAAKQVAKYALPSAATIETLRPMVSADIPQVHKLFNDFLNRYEIVSVFSEEETAHWLSNPEETATERVVYTYVVEDPTSKEITDFFSFYGLESTVLGNSKHDSIGVAYLFYYASKTGIPYSAKSESKLASRLSLLMQNALIIAKQNGFDVFNALSVQDNALFLEDLKFAPGDGFLNYYLFNYKTFPIHGGIDDDRKLERKPGGVGVVML